MSGIPWPRRPISIHRNASLAFLMILTLGCGTALGPVYSAQPPPDEGGRLVFYRPKAFSASATDALIGIEQCKRPGGLVHLANGSFTRFDAVAGKVLVISGLFAITNREIFDIAPGEEIYYRVKLGGFPLKIQKARVSKSEAQSELRELREAPVDPTAASREAC